MKESNIKRTVYIMIIGLAVNYIGKHIANLLLLPLWLDSIGTAITAGLLGPIYGAMCGFTSNIIYGITDITQLIFAVTNFFIGIVVGISVKKGMLDKFFGVFYLSTIIVVISVAVSTPLSCIFWNGFTGNIWGTGVVEMLKENTGWGIATCSLIGQIFIEVPDKFICILCLYVVLIFKKKYTLKIEKTILFLVVIITGVIMSFTQVSASEIENLNYDDSYYSSLYSSSTYSSDNGLSSGEVNAIAQTKDGYIWVGTYAGLYSYDDTRFELKKEFDSVKNVNCLYVDEPGRLWVGTNDSGISLIIKGKVSSVLSKKDGLSSDSVRCIAADSDGNYYVGTSAGMCVCSLDSGLKIVKSFNEVNYAKNISVSSDGTVAVINNEGELFIIKDMEIRNSYKPDIEGKYYSSCCFLRDNTLIIGDSDNNIYTWNFEEEKVNDDSIIKVAGMQNINSIREDSEIDGQVWICFNNGIGYFNKSNKFYALNTGNFNSSIDNEMTDYQGNIWFTSSRLGLLKLSKNLFTNIYQKYQINSAVVNSVVVWNNKLYSGTDGGLDIIDLESDKVIENNLTDMFKDNRIRCLKVDSNNNLWICVTDGRGLCEVSPSGEIKIYNTDTGTVDNRFRSIIEMHDGTFAVAENTGISFISDGVVTNTLTLKDGLICPQILSLIEKDNNTLLAGSDGSGIFVIKDKKIVAHLTRENGLSSDVILRITQCDDGYFIVTANGLCYMDENYNIYEINNFPYFNNYDTICMKNGSVWVLSSAGFFVVDKNELIENENIKYQQLERKSGFMSSLTANSWSYIDEQGNAYFCCNSGVYSINTNSYNELKTSCRMKVEKIVVDGTEYDVNQHTVINLSGSVKKIEIKPVVFNYTLSNPLIRYYLEGFEDDATIVRQSDLNSIVYTNLSAGTYKFQIELLDNQNNSILEKCTYEIVKKREFWDNWWFRVYFISAASFILIFITYIIIKRHNNAIIESQKKEIEFMTKQARMGNETILAIAKTVDAKDDNTSQHSERVAEYSVLIAEKLGWPKERIDSIRKVALLHDIGKIGIPDSILKKPDRLTNDEYEIMKSHVTIGADILKDFSLVENVAEGARYHHERYDGTGYVSGLKGKEIPINARIIGVADAFDAMTSNRVYRKHLDIDYVIEEMKRQKGKQFDPEIVDVLVSLIDSGKINVNSKEI